MANLNGDALELLMQEAFKDKDALRRVLKVHEDWAVDEQVYFNMELLLTASPAVEPALEASAA